MSYSRTNLSTDRELDFDEVAIMQFVNPNALHYVKRQTKRATSKRNFNRKALRQALRDQ